MQEVFDRILQEIQRMHQSLAGDHDYYHPRRVFDLALRLQEREGGDRLVIGVSALTHDVHRVMEQESGKYCSPKDSLDRVGSILGYCPQISKRKRERILHSVEFHEEYDFSKTGKTVHDIETLILQDADNIDAIGAVGIGRTYTFGGSHDLPMWIPEIPFDRECFDESQKDVSTIHHFYSKLLRLKENMNTETAKQMAEHRHKFMEFYLEEFFQEWKGEK